MATLKQVKSYLIWLLLLGAAMLAACSAQTQSSRGGDVNMGRLPNDICIVDGRPLVVSISVENGGDIDFAYISTKGELINQKYGGGWDGVGTDKMGRMIWQGASCPSSQNSTPIPTPMPDATPSSFDHSEKGSDPS